MVQNYLFLFSHASNDDFLTQFRDNMNKDVHYQEQTNLNIRFSIIFLKINKAVSFLD